MMPHKECYIVIHTRNGVDTLVVTPYKGECHSIDRLFYVMPSKACYIVIHTLLSHASLSSEKEEMSAETVCSFTNIACAFPNGAH